MSVAPLKRLFRIHLVEFMDAPLKSSASRRVSAEYRYPLARPPLWLSGLVTVTVTEPAALAGVVAVMEVLLVTLTPVAAELPNMTVAPATNPVPDNVTWVPPAGVPEFGETAVGAGGPL